jgi:hypothetical protein
MSYWGDFYGQGYVVIAERADASIVWDYTRDVSRSGIKYQFGAQLQFYWRPHLAIVTVLRPHWDHPFRTSFSSIHLRHSSRCASPFDVSKPIWVYMVVHAMLLPCLGTPADAHLPLSP